MTEPLERPPMRRRQVLAAAALAAVPGCTDAIGFPGEEEDDLQSEGTDDEPIEGPVEDLLLSVEDFEGEGWQRREVDEDGCREFDREADEVRTVVTSCAWLYDDVAEAEDEYETLVDRTWKLSDGSPADREPPVGVEATFIQAGLEIHVLFRDANAVGSIEYVLHPDGSVRETDLPEFEEAVEHAVRMHRGWRD